MKKNVNFLLKFYYSIAVVKPFMQLPSPRNLANKYAQISCPLLLAGEGMGEGRNVNIFPQFPLQQ